MEWKFSNISHWIIAHVVESASFVGLVPKDTKHPQRFPWFLQSPDKLWLFGPSFLLFFFF